MTPSRYGVIIAGAGPTGLTLANLLGIYGVRVLVVERNATTVDEPRAVSIDDEGLRTMQAAGLAGDVLAAAVPGYGYRYLSPSGRCFATVTPAAMPYGYPRRSAFRQPVLERQLRGGLAGLSSVEARFEHTLESFHQDGQGVAVTVRGPEARAREVECDYLVGCDGAASTVRRLLGVPLAGASFSERWLIIDLEESEVASPHTLVFCDPARPGIALPGPDRTRRVEFKVLPDERDDDLLRPPAIRRLLAAHGTDPESVIRRAVVYRFHARVAARWAAGRALLAGDAAHLSPPFAGQGMNSGLRDAHNLAWKIAAVVQGQMGPGLLESYEAERRPHVWEMIRLALRMGRVMAPRSRAEAWAVEQAVRLLDLYPPARDYITEMRWRPAPRFRSGFLVPDGRPAGETLVGRLLPQPWVVTADGRSVRLDAVLGNRFVLLAWTARPGEAFAAVRHDVWRRLDATRVAVLPCGVEDESVRRSEGLFGAEVVRDRDGHLAAALARYPNHVLLLRPDHYVAACLPADGPARGAAAVEALVART
ncbi:MAG TPA: bifunctional 3-(3-hydroxy-phenyl)propionate/3-hydroxycinnamic acid hydroxylase [bacterium]|nr:bifunctional 3-(3-hydroxy-phenyl)propionate/3-hydroxycinnamic acid hydroxylase [bacterium]